jgi:23S rRNA pseudouridine1911/1915/1917 synthase
VRLDLALIVRHPELSRRKARDVIEKGQVSVDGALVRAPGQDVATGSRVCWDPNRRALPRPWGGLSLLYADRELLVADKPAGLLTVPTDRRARDNDTLLGRVESYVRRRAPGAYVGRVHRLDRDTSGAVVFALTPQARAALLPAFRAHQTERRYLALVSGIPPQDRGVIRAPIHGEYRRGRRRLARRGEAALSAVTRYEVWERFGEAALLEARLETGRQHQLRLHLSSIGAPVLGDRVYGNPRIPSPSLPVQRQMLHAWVLAFALPESGRTVRVVSPVPPDFQQLLTRLRRAKG